MPTSSSAGGGWDLPLADEEWTVTRSGAEPLSVTSSGAGGGARNFWIRRIASLNSLIAPFGLRAMPRAPRPVKRYKRLGMPEKCDCSTEVITVNDTLAANAAATESTPHIANRSRAAKLLRNRKSFE